MAFFEKIKMLYLSCHSVLEYDELKLFHEIGLNVFSHGAYIDPRNPDDKMRPSLDYEIDSDLIELARANPNKNNLSKEFLDKFNVIFTMWRYDWLRDNWDKIEDKICIIRTIGQSIMGNEYEMKELKKMGVKIVRYSPLERTNAYYAGEDCLIRFYKDPEEFKDWNGSINRVITLVQDFKRRGEWCNFDTFIKATEGLPRKAYGKNNENLGELGESFVDYDTMKKILKDNRVYFYGGTIPASYTLNFIEAFMTGIPIVAIGYRLGNSSIFPDHFLYEIPLIIRNREHGFWSDSHSQLKSYIELLLKDYELAKEISQAGRQRAIELFGKDKIKEQWKEFFEQIEKEI